MSRQVTELSPVQQAEQARQVVNVLTRMEQRFATGKWGDGYRFTPGGGTCLIGGIDEATRWALPGVADEVTGQLARRLPEPFRTIGRVRPRLALAMYNDTVGGRAGAIALVRATCEALGGVPRRSVWVEASQVPMVTQRAQPDGARMEVRVPG